MVPSRWFPDGGGVATFAIQRGQHVHSVFAGGFAAVMAARTFGCGRETTVIDFAHR